MLYCIFVTLLLTCSISCKESNTLNYRRQYTAKNPNINNPVKAKLILTYIDSIIKLPNAKFNDAGIRSLNKRFLSELPLAMHDSVKGDNRKDIIIQFYRCKEPYPEVGSGIILLIPKAISDSLVVSDFTNYFGNIKNEKTYMSITAQPLPVYINVSSERSIKLTFNNNEKQSKAAVTTVELLNH